MSNFNQTKDERTSKDEKLKSIKYFPWIELIIFIITTTLTFVFVSNIKQSIWLSILVTVSGYIILLSPTNYISVTNDKIEIIFFNLFGGRVSIDLNKILKISTYETYEMQTAHGGQGSYYLFSNEYNLDFLDNKEKKRSLIFRINNRKKEIEIIKRINNVHRTK